MRILTLTVLCLSLLCVGSPIAGWADEGELVKDINVRPVRRDSLCGDPVPVDGKAFFCGANRQLWVTDGTPDGTRPVQDQDGLILTEPGQLVAAGRWLYFVSGDEFWRTDGTAQATRRIVDESGRSIDPLLMTNVDDQLYFFRFNLDSSFLHELWKTDGTTAGTRRIYRFPTRLDPNDAAAVNGELYFTNYTHQLWKSDGTAAGTRLLKDIEGYNYSGSSNNLTNVAGTLFFSLENPGRGRDLWKSGGTAATTVLVKEDVSARYFSVGNFVDVGGRLYFTADSDYNDTVIWRSDGTTGGTGAITTLSGVSARGPAGAQNGTYLVGTSEGL